MNHADHVALLRPGGVVPGGVWADLGSGTGAFTLALAELLGPGGVIVSVDRDQAALREQAAALRQRFPAVAVQPRAADFTRPLAGLPALDGIVMANALHFVRDQAAVVSLCAGYLKPGGQFILVEYNAEAGNHWVPYPLSYPRWEKLARQCGFAATRLLATRPSRFLREIYSALSG